MPLRVSTYQVPASGRKRWMTLPRVEKKMRPPLRIVSVPEASAAMLLATKKINATKSLPFEGGKPFVVWVLLAGRTKTETIVQQTKVT